MTQKKPSLQSPKAQAKSPAKLPGDSRDALIQAAKHVFAEKGYEGATVKDLCDAAQVNASLVSYYFGGKEGLYRTCLETFGKDRLEVAERILSAPKNLDEMILRLKLFAEEIVIMNSREADTCRMMFRGMEKMDTISAEIFRNVFYRVFLALQNFLASAQKTGLLRQDFDMETTTSLMFGSLIHQLRSQEIVKLLGKPTLDDPAFRTQMIEHWVGAFTGGLLQQNQSSSPSPKERL